MALLTLTAVLSLLATLQVAQGKQNASTTKYWFSFGDSYTATGFSIKGKLPTVDNTFGNPPYPGATSCGHNPNWLDLTVKNYGNHTPLEVWNHAYSGATINRTLVGIPKTTPDLDQQVATFLQYEGPKPRTAPWNGNNSLFSIWFGINDIGNSYNKRGKNTTEFNDVLMDAYFREVQAIYDVGGRQFLFLNVPPMERSPLRSHDSTSLKAHQASLIADYNKKLVARAQAFQKSHHGVTTHIYDAHTKVTQFLNNPPKYGFVNATAYGDVTKDIWCNNYHISSAAGGLVAVDIAKLLKSIHFLN